MWGHDLRVEGIVVEPLHGVDDLAAAIRSFSPTPGRRLGILVDHLIEGTKEQRIVAEALAVPGAAGNVKIVGHPFIDIWQAVKPAKLGLKTWPAVPHGEDWKKGTLRRLGQPHATQEDVRTPGSASYLGWIHTRISIRPCWVQWNHSLIF